MDYPGKHAKSLFSQRLIGLRGGRSGADGRTRSPALTLARRLTGLTTLTLMPLIAAGPARAEIDSALNAKAAARIPPRPDGSASPATMRTLDGAIGIGVSVLALAAVPLPQDDPTRLNDRAGGALAPTRDRAFPTEASRYARLHLDLDLVTEAQPLGLASGGRTGEIARQVDLIVARLERRRGGTKLGIEFNYGTATLPEANDWIGHAGDHASLRVLRETYLGGTASLPLGGRAEVHARAGIIRADLHNAWADNAPPAVSREVTMSGLRAALGLSRTLGGSTLSLDYRLTSYGQVGMTDQARQARAFQHSLALGLNRTF